MGHIIKKKIGVIIGICQLFSTLSNQLLNVMFMSPTNSGFFFYYYYYNIFRTNMCYSTKPQKKKEGEEESYTFFSFEN